MPAKKPLPFMVGNKAYYTLTSYDPVDVTVEILQVTDEDVALGLEVTVSHLGGTMADLDNPEWVQDNFIDLTTRAQVTEAVRRQLGFFNEQAAEREKLSACIEVLRTRLVQAIPPQHLQEARRAAQIHFEHTIEAEGVTPEQFIERMGTPQSYLDAMLNQQAIEIAESDAVLSAYAHEKRLTVERGELPDLLNLPPEKAKELIDDAVASGNGDDLREVALRSKAARQIVAECRCTYVHETPEQARARVANYSQMSMVLDDIRAETTDEPPTEHRTGFRLV